MEFCGGGSLQDIYHSERDTHTHNDDDVDDDDAVT